MKVERISAFSFENTGGNPAGVVFSENALSDEKMLDIAKEVNYSETAFLIKQDDAFKIRYFSPKTEIPFCGHATIASGSYIADKFGLGTYDLFLNNGNIKIDLTNKNGKNYTTITSVKTHTKDVNNYIINSVLKIFNFEKEDLDEKYPIKISYSGNNHLIVFLNDKTKLQNMEYDFDKATKFVNENEIVTISILYQESDEVYHSRNAFAYGGVYEDPATGSAAVALAEYLRYMKIKTSGELEILQGFDMNQPSKLYVSYSHIENSEIKVSGESRKIEG